MRNEKLEKKIIEVAVVRGLLGDYTKLTKNIINTKVDEIMGNNYLYALIFTFEFAKAFWGEENLCMICGNKRGRSGYTIGVAVCVHCNNSQKDTTLEAWEYHLRQMVLNEEPLKYLERFLEAKNERKI